MHEHLRRQSSSTGSLTAIIAQVRKRWRTKLLLRGAVAMAGVSLALFLLTAFGMEWARFNAASILAGRIGLVAALVACAAWFLGRPMRRKVTDEQVALYLEEQEPSLQSTLISAVEASRAGNPHDRPFGRAQLGRTAFRSRAPCRSPRQRSQPEPALTPQNEAATP